MIYLKRVYDKVDIRDGTRILIDKLWPRGVRRSTSNIDLWLKEVGPSDDLRKWFAHEKDKWPEFRRRYEQELKKNPAFEKLVDIALSTDPITLLYAASDKEHNNGVVLFKMLNKRIEQIKKAK
ncbi:hypothetical protein Micr_00939 [Candidatus Micrarchaeum sp.]|jgi:uncharacterized protein YeaO (DUF488 family)|uniref:DUF488 domain-containing protein n=1 Tax=Candidatus Micrarchaeum sp. TaxID=2282148 RepID=UPI000925B525|nr:DUF488 family protein [Candidatus Micrarchaeum sp.]OJT93989.1 MAG: uroporphyrin-III methyltransferase [Candidatus Micrarchaeum sp. AZ1]OWP53913.1 MAG: hypothetical protein B2I19_01150 [Thermoplasmatales archaeon ARMAN]QRF74403.1 hypothetical protein Micr_00939 [Candidatus Micrarchaeum sp.]